MGRVASVKTGTSIMASRVLTRALSLAWIETQKLVMKAAMAQ